MLERYTGVMHDEKNLEGAKSGNKKQSEWHGEDHVSGHR
jgi:hypothetical protein